MEVRQTNIPGVLIIEPRVFKDSRGYFFESFSQREFDEPTNEARAESSVLELCLARRRKTVGQKVTPILGHSINFVQDNESMSSYGVMRGLHYQRMPYTQIFVSYGTTRLKKRDCRNIYSPFRDILSQGQTECHIVTCLKF